MSTLNIWRLEPRSQLGNYFNSLVINGGVRGNKPIMASYWKSRMILQGHGDFLYDPPSTVYCGRHAEVTAGKIRSSSLESKKYLLEGGWRAYSEGREGLLRICKLTALGPSFSRWTSQFQAKGLSKSKSHLTGK